MLIISTNICKHSSCIAQSCSTTRSQQGSPYMQLPVVPGGFCADLWWSHSAYLLRALAALCSRSSSLHIYTDDMRPETFLVFTHSLPKDASRAVPSVRHLSTAEVVQFKYRPEKSPMYTTHRVTFNAEEYQCSTGIHIFTAAYSLAITNTISTYYMLPLL